MATEDGEKIETSGNGQDIQNLVIIDGLLEQVFDSQGGKHSGVQDKAYKWQHGVGAIFIIDATAGGSRQFDSLVPSSF